MIMENVLDLMRERHSVRSYEPTPIGATAVAALNDLIAQCNREGDLNIRLITEERRAFGNILTHYGQFHGVRNYFALAGKNAPDLYERVGYHGERLVLEAQRLGLNTCWVALSYSKRRVPMVLDKDERLVCVIAVGHGTSPGHGHKVRTFDQVAHAHHACGRLLGHSTHNLAGPNLKCYNILVLIHIYDVLFSCTCLVSRLTRISRTSRISRLSRILLLAA